MKQVRIVFGALVALLLSGAAQAQVATDIRPERLVDNPLKALGLQGRQAKGHDKCKGNGHKKETGGGGHEEGECDEDTPTEETPTGPVATTVCEVDSETVVESSWSRASCAVVSYNENYINAVIADNEDYPTELATYATDTGSYLTSDATRETLTAYGVEVLNDLGNGGNLADIVGGVGNPPAPRNDYLENTVAISFDGAADYVGQLQAYGTGTVTTVLDGLGNGGNLADIVGGVGNPPSPRRDVTATISTDGLVVDGVLVADVSTTETTTYVVEVRDYTVGLGDSALVGGNYDGGNLADIVGGVGNPPAPRNDAYIFKASY